MTALIGFFWWKSHPAPNIPADVGRVLDTWQGIPVYDNGLRTHDTYGKSVAPDGYVFGWKYQCVEFIKRYYFHIFHHRMPDGQGNARDYWNADIPDGHLNSQRGLLQFNVPSTSTVQANDILVYSYAPYGHVALVMEIRSDTVFFIQQNMGNKTRDTVFISFTPAGYRISDARVRGWLRHPHAHAF